MSGHPIRSAAELLGKVPEGAEGQQHRRSLTGSPTSPPPHSQRTTGDGGDDDEGRGGEWVRGGQMMKGMRAEGRAKP